MKQIPAKACYFAVLVQQVGDTAAALDLDFVGKGRPTWRGKSFGEQITKNPNNTLIVKMLEEVM